MVRTSLRNVASNLVRSFLIYLFPSYLGVISSFLVCLFLCVWFSYFPPRDPDRFVFSGGVIFAS